MENKILINWGGFDADNFGDLLFPFIIEHYYGSSFKKILHCSPTGEPNNWLDSKSTNTILDSICRDEEYCLLIGGGNIVSFSRATAIQYLISELHIKYVYPSFSILPLLLFKKYNIHYAFNSVGVRNIDNKYKKILNFVICNSTYVSCRDVNSRDNLLDCGIIKPINVSVDSAFQIDKVFSKQYLTDKYYTDIVYKYNLNKKSKKIVFHINNKYLKNDIGYLINFITLITKTYDIHPIFIALGPCHNDNSILQYLPESIKAISTIIDRPTSIVDIIAILAYADYYIGSSMHGGLVSLVYGNKIAYVVDEKLSNNYKFTGFLSKLNITSCICNSWKDSYINYKKVGIDLFKGTLPNVINIKDTIDDNFSNIKYSFEKIQSKPNSNFIDPDELLTEIEKLYELQ